MGFFVSLLSVSLLVFITLFLGVKVYSHFCPLSFLHSEERIIAFASWFVFTLGGILLSIMNYFPIHSLIVWIIASLAALSLESSSLSKQWKHVLSFLLCFGGVLNLYQFSQNTILMVLFSTSAWFFVWRLFIWFDRFAFTSFLNSVAWAFALFSVGLIMHTIPFFVSTPAVLIGTSVIALSYLQLNQKRPCLGFLSASLVGFIWAGIWGYFILNGAVFQVLTAFGYYLFEGVALAIAFHYHRPLQTYLTKLLGFPNLASKAVSAVFSHLLILSFLSTMTIHMKWLAAPILLFALLVVLVDLYLRLNNLIHPQPTWRELLKNTKEGFSLFTQQIKEKTNSPVKKTTKPHHKKAPSKRKKKK